MKLMIDITEGMYNKLKDIQFGSIYSKVLFNKVKEGVPYKERPTGWWIPARGTYYCSFCKHFAYESQRFNFCQDCGADMRGGTE